MEDSHPFRMQVNTLRTDFSECKRIDANRYNLVESLFDVVEQLHLKLAETKAELQKKKDLEDIYFKRSNEYSERLYDIKQKIGRSSFVSVLIDGDCMLFKDVFVKQGDSGGREAAHMLKRAVTEYLKSELESIDSNSKIIIRVYANIRGLSKAYKDFDILSTQFGMEEFVRGFNMADPLCDFVDAGSGKECSDEKIRENFKSHMASLHCHHVMFGASADNGYARLLEPYGMVEDYRKRITMIEGSPFAKELVSFMERFSVTSFDQVFRNTKLGSKTVTSKVAPQPTLNPNYAAAVTSSGSMPPNSVMTLKDDASVGVPPILRNSKGQRIDSVLQYFQNDVEALKKRKLCNSYHILAECPFRGCTHTHGPRLSDKQLEALRAVARLTPCSNGLACKDKKCIAGHQCPRKQCNWQGCRFRKNLHDVDRNIFLSG
ncbi:C-x8-C-x5-C-x3-H type zinc finger protein-like protein [Dendryphion nanum]|uniref:C-x8-C-x5-C-x3-H type zinc finger protein-like protein n=1 Tax=Dendryphion nanum TaxID=256645 RepID=A0A9P9CYQ1_9PLEO|nr:C-x8-C-x5-C-x3-H type zinc finger protein-like protein [Dendryphion nanum]